MTALTDNEISMRRYRRHAEGYDASARATMPIRLRAVALLALRPGDVVIDAGGGTGLSYAPLLAAVGPVGRVLACEQSPEMFARADARVRRHGWTCVWHCRASAEQVSFPEPADAILFNYVHDICRTPQAVDNLMRQLKPGARVALAGMKFFPWWTGPLNLLAWAKNRPYNARSAELWTPWNLVQRHCRDFERRATQAGMGYLACGRKRGDAP